MVRLARLFQLGHDPRKRQRDPLLDQPHGGLAGAYAADIPSLSPASEMGPAVRHDLGTTWPGYVSIMVWPGRCRQLGAGR